MKMNQLKIIITINAFLLVDISYLYLSVSEGLVISDSPSFDNGSWFKPRSIISPSISIVWYVTYSIYEPFVIVAIIWAKV